MMRRLVGFVLGVLLAVPVLAADCTTGQLPWSALIDSSTGSGESAYEACQLGAIARAGAGAFSYTDGASVCKSRSSTGASERVGTVTQDCTVPAPSGSIGTVSVSVTAGTMTFPDIFQIDSEGGASIAGAILAVWAVAWGFRMVIRSLNVDGKTSSTSESE